jgi:NDP-sugar pyrophosphorylase family protein
MRAVILAGGLGMRLRPYTAILPKPLLPIGERPVIEHILRRLSAFGVERVDLSVAHLGELIRIYLSEATDLTDSLDLRWHWEDEPLGTAGALKVIPDLEGTFLVMNGDVLSNIDLGELAEVHDKSDAALTIAMRAQRVDISLGVIESSEGVVTGYNEKPTLHYEVSMGIYIYEQRALGYLPEGACQFPDLVKLLLEAGERVAAYRSDADWFDIGTFPEYERAVRYVEENPSAFDL